MPSAIEVHLPSSGVFFWFFKVHPKSNENSRIVKFCRKLLNVYAKSTKIIPGIPSLDGCMKIWDG